MNASNNPTETHLDFRREERKSIFKRLSTRAVIYPIIILAVYFLMDKNKQLTEQGEREAQREQQQQTARQILDASKPAELVPTSAPAFPQLIFYHENNLKDMTVVEQLRDKYYKICTVQPVDLTQNAALKHKYASQKTPFAVLSLPDGKEITFLDIPSFEFYDNMLKSSLLVRDKATAPKSEAPTTHKP